MEFWCNIQQAAQRWTTFDYMPYQMYSMHVWILIRLLSYQVVIDITRKCLTSLSFTFIHMLQKAFAVILACVLSFTCTCSIPFNSIPPTNKTMFHKHDTWKIIHFFISLCSFHLWIFMIEKWFLHIVDFVQMKREKNTTAMKAKVSGERKSVNDEMKLQLNEWENFSRIALHVESVILVEFN